MRNHFLSLDPYMRGRMDDAKSYAAPQAIGETMVGGTAGIVEASQNPKFAVGDAVVGYLGWQEYGVSDGTGLNKVETKHVPLSAYLGARRHARRHGLVRPERRSASRRPARRCWCPPRAAPSGSVVGQLAKMAGCRAVGIAGGPEKCAYVRDELGFDACIDHREHKDVRSMSAALKEAAPNGIDGLFENVGGIGLDAALTRMNAFGRIAVCGLIAGYEGGDIAIHNTRALLVNRLTLRGFIVSEHLEFWPQALGELAKGVATGKIKYRESIADGLAAAPEAFIGMLRGKNFGKQLVKLT